MISFSQICLFTCLFTCLFIYLFIVCLFICLLVCLVACLLDVTAITVHNLENKMSLLSENMTNPPKKPT